MQRKTKFSDSRTKSQKNKKSPDYIDRKSDEISERTDTARKATHWVKFYRQKKKPFFVPVTRRPAVKPNHKQKRRVKGSHVSWLPNQQTRGDHGGLYDKQRNINRMRKIGRRGLAANSFKFLQTRSTKTYKVAAKDKAVKKWSKFTDQTKDRYNPSATIHSKLTYLQKRYPGIEPRISRDALHFFRREVENRMRLRAKQMNRGI